MKVGGFQKFSLIEYPGKICAVIFTQGCNFRCWYCHNPELVFPELYSPEIPLIEIYDFLEKRKGKLEAVCITGGEPTQHADLIEVMKRIKDKGFLIKLDSNGSRPEVLKTMIELNLVDYLAIDVKAPLEEYSKIVGWQVPAEKLKKTIQLVIDANVDYEFRTTVVKSLVREDLQKIADSIKGAKKYYLQKFSPLRLGDDKQHKEETYNDKELNRLAKIFEKNVKFYGVR